MSLYDSIKILLLPFLKVKSGVLDSLLPYCQVGMRNLSYPAVKGK